MFLRKLKTFISSALIMQWIQIDIGHLLLLVSYPVDIRCYLRIYKHSPFSPRSPNPKTIMNIHIIAHNNNRYIFYMFIISIQFDLQIHRWYQFIRNYALSIHIHIYTLKLIHIYDLYSSLLSHICRSYFIIRFHFSSFAQQQHI